MKAKARVHYQAGFQKLGLCGRGSGKGAKLSTELNQVTCKTCLYTFETLKRKGIVNGRKYLSRTKRAGRHSKKL